MTVGSKSMNTALGTCLPELVSLKKVLNESCSTPIDASLSQKQKRFQREQTEEIKSGYTKVV